MSRTLTLAGAALLVAGTAAASPSVTVTNTTDVVAYQGTSQNGFFNGNSVGAPGQSIGPEFATQSLTASVAGAGAGLETLTLAYTTNFSGPENVGGNNVGFADIFLRTPSSGYSNAGFNYAIAIGGNPNGGVSAGFYQVGTTASSQDIWSGRSNAIYGGAYTSGQGQTQYAAPTLLKSGTYLGGTTFNETNLGNGQYKISETITIGAQLAALFSQGFDAFWGTGDCANGAFLATISGLDNAAVPEPASLALLGAGLAGLAFVRRRNKAAAAA